MRVLSCSFLCTVHVFSFTLCWLKYLKKATKAAKKWLNQKRNSLETDKKKQLPFFFDSGPGKEKKRKCLDAWCHRILLHLYLLKDGQKPQNLKFFEQEKRRKSKQKLDRRHLSISFITSLSYMYVRRPSTQSRWNLHP